MALPSGYGTDPRTPTNKSADEMARVDASHAIKHPTDSSKILLLRGTTNPTDPPGSFAVLKVVTQVGYDKHYAQQCEFISQPPSRVIDNQTGNIDAIIVNKNALSEAYRKAREEIARMTLQEGSAVGAASGVDSETEEEESEIDTEQFLEDEPSEEEHSEEFKDRPPISRVRSGNFSRSVVARFLSRFDG